MLDISWKSENHLSVNGINFYVTFDSKEQKSLQSSNELYIVGKAKHMIEKYLDLTKGIKINNIFELGIFKGGSTVLYDQLFSPEKIVAIDKEKTPPQALLEYIKTYKKQLSVKPYFNIDQSNKVDMLSILSNEFPNRNIDLIIDDASHLYKKTKASFNLSFPYLKPGGYYIIEDWAWAHWPGQLWQSGKWVFWKRNPTFGRTALSNLLVELCMITASRVDLIENIHVDQSLIIIKKGGSSLTDDNFDISEHYLLRGKKFKPFL